MYQKDIYGNDIKVGDTVFYINSKIRELKLGKVARITPKGLTIEMENGKLLSRKTKQVALAAAKEVVE